MKKQILILLSIALSLYACSDKKEAENKKSNTENAPVFQFGKVEIANVEQEVKLPAQLAAFQEVSIFPKVNGYVRKVLVDIGSKVNQGQVLMELEAPELEQATVQAREKWARARTDFAIDRENFKRLQIAAQTPGAISPQDIATARAKMEADSSLSNAEKASFLMQQTMMGYLTVRAPFAGVITQRNVHPGALVSAEGKDAKPMLELKEVDHLRLEVDIPENLASTLRNSDTLSFMLTAYPGVKRSGHISRKSQNINAQFRSERVEMDVYNRDGQLAPGMYADVLFNSKGNPGAFSVPKSAVVVSTERKYVMAIRNGKTVKVDVNTGNESHGAIEVTGSLQAGEPVLLNANDEIKEGLVVDKHPAI